MLLGSPYECWIGILWYSIISDLAICLESFCCMSSSMKLSVLSGSIFNTSYIGFSKHKVQNPARLNIYILANSLFFNHSCFRIVPESVRWLMAKQRNKKAYKIIKKAAKVNNVVLSDLVMATFQDTNNDKLGKVSFRPYSDCRLFLAKDSF